ncbi:DUF2849 domain-containing protein [Methylocapsa acidiphila]|uniref:DUF2849 domain-containing protein n=1 Tax=Methylocapsa acidiphila TaxID=133552 RepID=UPI00040C971D|nr:DUF2849 domain-containing protein [Methylocapsa acidiphila]
MSSIISANRLADGIVVYLGPDGFWRETLAKAALYEEAAAAEAGLRAARADVACNLVLDPFIVEVAHSEGRLRAMRMRDAIRADGPTIEFPPRTPASTARIVQD